MTSNQDAIKKDRLRFTKDALSADLTLLAIVFNALYFVSIYKSDVGSYYYTWMTGVSVVYNLLFMLAAFLSSEGVKAYKLGYSFLLIGLGAGQLIRILIIPVKAHETVLSMNGEEIAAMGDGQFMWVCVCLIASAALCIIAGLISFIKTRTLTSYLAELEEAGGNAV